MSKQLQAAIAAAERDLKQLNIDATCRRLRADDFKMAADIAARESEVAQLILYKSRDVVGRGYLQLMNSGISHRAFLVFVREVEHVRH